MIELLVRVGAFVVVLLVDPVVLPEELTAVPDDVSLPLSTNVELGEGVVVRLVSCLLAGSTTPATAAPRLKSIRHRQRRAPARDWRKAFIVKTTWGSSQPPAAWCAWSYTFEDRERLDELAHYPGRGMGPLARHKGI
ncbi:hypothetical protein B0H66DRAFT_566026 [Apodospora peruviana]|uniref:Secreted protein n=1 Tax=Apodospora peruviana TaxID=516989 RepID=A0AAE0HWT8_9PEZI|nr:hypothetical protein B0H66DRAFT_566026 [Apodospora peruviana]